MYLHENLIFRSVIICVILQNVAYESLHELLSSRVLKSCKLFLFFVFFGKDVSCFFVWYYSQEKLNEIGFIGCMSNYE